MNCKRNQYQLHIYISTYIYIFQIELTRLSPAAMAAYIRELESELYELSQREARELSRSKHLRIFGNNRRRSSK